MSAKTNRPRGRPPKGDIKGKHAAGFKIPSPGYNSIPPSIVRAAE